MNYKMAIEAILFAVGTGVTYEQLASALEIDEDRVRELVAELEQDYIREKRGIGISYVEELIQLSSSAEYYSYITRLVQKHREYTLSTVALETLAIIAYKQPVSKADIEQIRGVKSDYAVNQLIEYGLIEEVGRLNAPGKPLIFGTTKEFLRGFGISSIDELPKIQEEQISDFFDEARQELNYFPELQDETALELDMDLEDFIYSPE